MNWKSFLWPQKIYSTSSDISQKIEVNEFLGHRFLRVNGLTQSGSVVSDIYKNILPNLRIKKIENVLILGFGAGTIAGLLLNKYDNVKILGIEIDKKIIEIYYKYFSTSKNNKNKIKLINLSALDFLNSYHYDTAQYHSEFDLIFVDLYIGDKIDKSSDDIKFIQRLSRLLKSNGVIVFNRLNYQSHKSKNDIFFNKMKKIFKVVYQKRSYSNLLIYCSI